MIVRISGLSIPIPKATGRGVEQKWPPKKIVLALTCCHDKSYVIEDE